MFTHLSVWLSVRQVVWLKRHATAACESVYRGVNLPMNSEISKASWPGTNKGSKNNNRIQIKSKYTVKACTRQEANPIHLAPPIPLPSPRAPEPPPPTCTPFIVGHTTRHTTRRPSSPALFYRPPPSSQALEARSPSDLQASKTSTASQSRVIRPRSQARNS